MEEAGRRNAASCRIGSRRGTVVSGGKKEEVEEINALQFALDKVHSTNDHRKHCALNVDFVLRFVPLAKRYV